MAFSIDDTVTDAFNGGRLRQAPSIVSDDFSFHVNRSGNRSRSLSNGENEKHE
jgi:hypothetical protein